MPASPLPAEGVETPGTEGIDPVLCRALFCNADDEAISAGLCGLLPAHPPVNKKITPKEELTPNDLKKLIVFNASAKNTLSSH
jgi:hypothetical protein